MTMTSTDLLRPAGPRLGICKAVKILLKLCHMEFVLSDIELVMGPDARREWGCVSLTRHPLRKIAGIPRRLPPNSGHSCCQCLPDVQR